MPAGSAGLPERRPSTAASAPAICYSVGRISGGVRIGGPGRRPACLAGSEVRNFGCCKMVADRPPACAASSFLPPTPASLLYVSRSRLALSRSSLLPVSQALVYVPLAANSNRKRCRPAIDLPLPRSRVCALASRLSAVSVSAVLRSVGCALSHMVSLSCPVLSCRALSCPFGVSCLSCSRFGGVAVCVRPQITWPYVRCVICVCTVTCQPTTGPSAICTRSLFLHCVRLTDTLPHMLEMRNNTFT